MALPCMKSVKTSAEICIHISQKWTSKSNNFLCLMIHSHSLHLCTSENNQNSVHAHCKEEPSCGDTTFPLPSSIILPSRYQAANWQCPISMKKAVLLEKETKLQDESPLWAASRRWRLTASSFYKIINKPEPSQYFISRQIGASFTEGLPYGLSMERLVKHMYSECHANSHLHRCGFVVNPNFSFLGATPDAKICENGVTGILEVKCPYHAREMTLSEAVDNSPQFPLGFLDDGTIALKEESDTYYQVQGQLMITGAPFCDVAVYTKKELFIERVYPDVSFHEQLLVQLAAFYCRHILPNVREASVARSQ